MSRSERKRKSGSVASAKMDKTLVVMVEESYRHAKYGKVLKRRKKYYAHDEKAASRKVGEQVEIMETRPLSKTKRWRVVEQVG